MNKQVNLKFSGSLTFLIDYHLEVCVPLGFRITCFHQKFIYSQVKHRNELTTKYKIASYSPACRCRAKPYLEHIECRARAQQDGSGLMGIMAENSCSHSHVEGKIGSWGAAYAEAMLQQESVGKDSLYFAFAVSSARSRETDRLA